MKVFIDANLLIYLNTVTELVSRVAYEDFYLRLLTRYKAYTDVLVLDELIYVSRRRYGVPYDLTLEFIESIVKPYVAILPVGEEEFDEAARVIREYGLKPSDAIHVGAMRTNGIELIASEDRDFEKVGGLKRVWLR
ncbi:MAG: PIN domain nuclease [Thermoprotei archaeon]|nr:MAG: PIN domain nuclease [Thermoprotei archaeon]